MHLRTLFCSIVPAVLALAACSTGTQAGRMTVDEKICIRSLEQLSQILSPPERTRGTLDPTGEFIAVAASWAPGDPPIDVRQWVDAPRLVSRIVLNCGSPETSVLLAVGGQTKLVDITLRPVPYPRPARKGRVTIIELPPRETGDEEKD